jgi:hypothetical protein
MVPSIIIGLSDLLGLATRGVSILIWWSRPLLKGERSVTD